MYKHRMAKVFDSNKSMWSGAVSNAVPMRAFFWKSLPDREGHPGGGTGVENAGKGEGTERGESRKEFKGGRDLGGD